MRLTKALAVVCVVGLCAVMVSHGQEAGETKPAATVKLVKPWSDMTSLSDEQKAQIDQIHKDALAEIRAIRQKERAAILALLSEEQQQEVQTLTRRARAPRQADGAEQAGEAEQM